MSRTSAHFHGSYFNAEDEQITHELRSATRAARIDLDAFLALSSEDRAARWRQWDRGAKFQAVATMFERKDGDWNSEAVEQAIAHYDAKWGTEIVSDLPLPPAADIAELAKERYDQARLHGDYPGARQLDRVRANVLGGSKLAWHAGDLLISSLNIPGAVYSVSRRGCTCPNGSAGKASCWHVALFDLLLDMQQTAADTADMEADLAAELALRDRIVAARRLHLEAA